MQITKSSSAAYRMVLDSLRTLAVWLADLASGGGRFHPLQLVGFALMLGGTSVYNEAVRLPCVRYPTEAERTEAREARERQRARSQALLGAEAPPAEPSAPPSDAGSASWRLPGARPNEGAPWRLGASAEPGPAPVPSPPSARALRVDEFFTPHLTRFTMQKS